MRTNPFNKKKISKSLSVEASVKKISPKRKSRRIPQENSEDLRIGLHNLAVPPGCHKAKKMLGRGQGSGHGKTSSRGSKGQTSRSGRDFYLGFEGGQSPFIRKVPKRGFHCISRKEFQIVNLHQLQKVKEETVTLELLEKIGLIKDKGKLVKILGDGAVKNPLTVQAHAFSKKAAELIQSAGGKVEIIHA
ncbi:MAG: 50S ribosomal protein L15 [Candidatus Omnitrophica bacterium]|nr:50S ribosomal protein L15 [Candidatus Omnitrophota bacterium]